MIFKCFHWVPSITLRSKHLNVHNAMSTIHIVWQAVMFASKKCLLLTTGKRAILHCRNEHHFFFWKNYLLFTIIKIQFVISNIYWILASFWLTVQILWYHWSRHTKLMLTLTSWPCIKGHVWGDSVIQLIDEWAEDCGK